MSFSFAPTKLSFAGIKLWFASTKLSFGGSKPYETKTSRDEDKRPLPDNKRKRLEFGESAINDLELHFVKRLYCCPEVLLTPEKSKGLKNHIRFSAHSISR